MQQDPLSALRDIHWPTPQGFWPLAIGYYVVIFLGILLILGLVYLALFGLRKRKIKKAIWQEYLQIEKGYLENSDEAMLQAKISALLKRLVFFKDPSMPRSRDLLSMRASLKKILRPKKADELIELLVKDRFQKNPLIDGDYLKNLAREEIKRCRI